MKQPKFIYKDVECEVTGVHWHKGGRLSHVAFYDTNGEFKVAHQTMPSEKENIDRGGNLNLDLYKRLKEGE